MQAGVRVWEGAHIKRRVSKCLSVAGLAAGPRLEPTGRHGVFVGRRLLPVLPSAPAASRAGLLFLSPVLEEGHPSFLCRVVMGR